ncbi:flagellar motor protein [Noviherbaspirillum denitrificans]|uniref:Flagellar motor protein n=1 Tax=Noviherbaspirillum denitrificans TaxID=1968433 RepID=A0A254TGW1_9BURK|nr:flagellar motor protein [Noviherbaspirillum denitrificans]OWW21387.1 flagellar motor protein [Noviherbaspirillum denitrificans]
MDWASLAGLALAVIAVLSGQALEGGHLDSLIQPAAFVIVVIGTMGAVLLQSGTQTFLRGARMLRWIFVPPEDKTIGLAQQITIWSATARREGLLSLERYVESVQDAFTVKGLRLIVDGIDPYKIREILDVDISTYERRERQAVRIWEAAGGYAPTIGILGAVLGLIQVMENLTEPSKLGGGIAVAFVATVYGVGLANLVFLPIANKLKSLVADEVRRREMLTDVFCSVANGDNARIIEERILAYR